MSTTWIHLVSVPAIVAVSVFFGWMWGVGTGRRRERGGRR